MDLLQSLMTVEAEIRVPLATARLVRYRVTEPVDHEFLGEQRDAHRLDLTLTPRPDDARACYSERWSPDRFERMGDVVFVPAGEVQRVRGGPSPRPLVSINCLLHAEPIRALFEDDLAWTDRQLDASLDIQSDEIRGLIMRLGKEARHPGFASQMLADLVAGQIVIELFRCRGALLDGPAIGGLAPWRLRIIDERLAEGGTVPTLTELAGLCGLSVRQLTRCFRASRGCSIGEYVAASQIHLAKRLLATGQSIKAIAYSLGFCSPSNFALAFRRATGCTPSEFRKHIPH